MLATLLALLATPVQPDGDRLTIPEVEPQTLRRWAALEERGDPKEMLQQFVVLRDGFGHLLVRADDQSRLWIPLARRLAARVAAFPPEALEAHEAVARQLLDTTREPVARALAAEKHAHTKAGRAALEELANAAADEDRVPDALRGWWRALETRPTPPLVARLGFAHARRGETAAIAALRAHAHSIKLEGSVLVGGRDVDLYAFLDGLQPAPPPAPSRAPEPPPATNEIRVGRFETRRYETYAAGQAAAIPAAARIDGRDVAVFTTGTRVLAVDPSKAEGGSLEDCLTWCWPRDGEPVNSDRLAPFSVSAPSLGVSVQGDRVFATMFSQYGSRWKNVGRRRRGDADAPRALRAFRLSDGSMLWDTDAIEVEKDGESLPFLQTLGFGGRNFGFSGPPLPRGDRVFAAVSTSPVTGRECHVVCLDAAGGKLLWEQVVARAPAVSTAAAIASIAEADGTLVVSTNFGVVAALDAATGAPRWLVQYCLEVDGLDLVPLRPNTRPSSSLPLITKGVVVVLPQEVDEPLLFDLWTGRSLPWPKPSKAVSWPAVQRLEGHVDGWLVFSGLQSAAIRIRDGETVLLDPTPAKAEIAKMERPGTGAIVGGRVYLPSRTALRVFDAASWTRVSDLPWIEEAGVVAVAGPYVVLQADGIGVFQSVADLTSRFAPRGDAATMRPEAARQIATIFEASGRLKESVPAYRRALEGWKDDPAWRETAEGLRKKLEDLKARLGDEFPIDPP